MQSERATRLAEAVAAMPPGLSRDRFLAVLGEVQAADAAVSEAAYAPGFEPEQDPVLDEPAAGPGGAEPAADAFDVGAPGDLGAPAEPAEPGLPEEPGEVAPLDVVPADGLAPEGGRETWAADAETDDAWSEAEDGAWSESAGEPGGLADELFEAAPRERVPADPAAPDLLPDKPKRFWRRGS